jgi:DNA-binding NarL/FixJ family response regulator
MKEDVIRIAIVSPMLAVRVGLRTLVATDEKIDVIADGTSFAEFEADFDDLDVIVLEGDIPVSEWNPTANIESQIALLWVTDDLGAVESLRSVSCRAWGVVSEDATEAELLTAVYAVDLGFIIAPGRMLEPLWSDNYRVDGSGIIEALTPRETEVLQLVAQGLANKQIALELDISEHTVKFHISSIYSKLGAGNRTEAVRLGLRSGLIAL